MKTKQRTQIWVRNAPVEIEVLPEFGVGRKELQRVMSMYKSKHEGKEGESEELILRRPKNVESILVNIGKIEEILKKSPWQRRADEIDIVRREIKKIDAVSKVHVSIEGQADIARFAMLQIAQPGECVVREGDVGDAWYLVLDGTLKVFRNDRGYIKDILSQEGFGDVALLQNNSIRTASVYADVTSKLLRVNKSEYDRYLKPIHLRERSRLETFVNEIRDFDNWNERTKNILVGNMQLKRYKMGERIIDEGVSNSNLIYIMTGHCKITKRIIDDQAEKQARKLPTPFRPHRHLNDDELSIEYEVEIGILYRGACIDPESVLDRKPTGCTATAMCNMDIAFVDASTNIYNNDPIIDQDTAINIKKRALSIPDPSILQIEERNNRAWLRYRAKLNKHIALKSKQTKAIFQPRSDVSGSNRIDVAPALPVRLQPLKEPTDGRWPFHPSTWNMSKDVCKALAVTPVVV
mmetsp:Transcript_47718/g.149617  ORF Transcript_47718/g.149617 Transcript_47718/m.149617 type:complete len:465 (-) Transcript_47718:393-1787(-)